MGIYGASGKGAFATGVKTLAEGDASHTEGYNTKAIGMTSHAEGYGTEASGNFSHAEGYNTKANSMASHAEGFRTEASNSFAHTEGYNTIAGGYASHAEGFRTVASGNSSHAEGFGTIAHNKMMHAAGKYNIGTAGDTIHETGIGFVSNNIVIRKNAFEIYTDGRVVAPELTTTLIDGENTSPRVLVTKEWVQANVGGLENLGDLKDVSLMWMDNRDTLLYSPDTNSWYNGQLRVQDLGDTNIIGAQDGQILAYNANTGYWENITNAGGELIKDGAGYRLKDRDSNYYLPTGENAIDLSFNNYTAVNKSGASGNGSFAGGGYNYGYGTHAGTIASGISSFAFGGPWVNYEALQQTIASGHYSVACGQGTQAIGFNSVAMGKLTIARGDNSVALGSGATADGYGSFAFGDRAIVHADSYYSISLLSGEVSGNYSCGINSRVYGDHSFSMGPSSQAGEETVPADYAFAFGYASLALGTHSHAEGVRARAYNQGSFALGQDVEASADYSFALGLGILTVNPRQISIGAYNIKDNSNVAFEVGIGTSNLDRKNGFEIYTDGRVVAPELTTTLIDGDTTGKVLATKEWVQANVGGLENLGDTNIIGAQDGQILVYNASNQQWENKTAIDGGTF